MKNWTMKKTYICIAIAVAISVVVEALFAHPHYHYPWHQIPGADILIAFAGAWALILFSKKILGPILQREEDYYDGGDSDE